MTAPAQPALKQHKASPFEVACRLRAAPPRISDVVDALTLRSSQAAVHLLYGKPGPEGSAESAELEVEISRGENDTTVCLSIKRHSNLVDTVRADIDLGCPAELDPLLTLITQVLALARRDGVIPPAPPEPAR